MYQGRANKIFENRYDAGRQLAAKLKAYKGQDIVVMGIPNGGVAVALGVALALDAELDLVISRKIPLPLSPEGGFGAVTDDGTTIFNEEILARAKLSEQQINYQVNQVRSDIKQRSMLYLGNRLPVVLTDKNVIICDDGLASGYTMMAAVESIRHRQPNSITVAVPVGPQDAVEKVFAVADSVVTCAVGTGMKFYVSDYYKTWYDVSDAEAVQCLKEWKMRRYQAKIDLSPKNKDTVA